MNGTAWNTIVPRRVALASLLVAPLVLGCPGTPTPSPRPGPAFDGSARWALALAQADLDELAPDAELYTVLGALVYEDGRLPPDTGTWSFVGWSPSQQEELQVTVRYDGTISKTMRSTTSPPSHNGLPVPVGWANSTVVFAAVAPHLPSDATHAQLVVFNMASYPPAPDEAVWGISYDRGGNHLVSADGSYLGPQQ